MYVISSRFEAISRNKNCNFAPHLVNHSKTINMDSKLNESKLFAEFPPVTTPEWEEKIGKDLKGADYERKLVWKTGAGFKVKPYYRNEDLEDIKYLESQPGKFPFVRGTKEASNSWHIRQDILVKDLKAANAKALDVLMKGVDSLGFILDEEHAYTTEELELLLQGIVPDAIELNFICGHNAHRLLSLLEELAAKHQWDTNKMSGSVDFDPLGHLSLKGHFCCSSEHSFKQIKNIITASENLPNYTSLAIAGHQISNAGASIVEELGFSLSMGNEYLSNLTDMDISVDDAAPRIRFNFAVGSNYFLEIAKMRAARLLWAQIVKAYNPQNEASMKLKSHTVTTDWNKTVYDPYVNMLRTTTEAMSAALGGTDSLTVRPFNAHYEETTDFSERIARNQQLLLKEESNFDKIADPAAGSYYIENLTNSIAEEAWKLFLAVEDKGGYTEAFKKGFIQETVEATAQQRNMNIATRKEILLGTNQFPNFTEQIDKLDPKLFEAKEQPLASNIIAQPLKPYRGAMEFEILRYKTDQFAQSNKRPLAFMLTIGNLTMRKARAQFACNFFACAGFQVQDNNGFATIEEGLAAAREARADIIVICSSDDEYTTLAPQAKEQLGDEAILVVAGYPKAVMDELSAQGIQNFIHVKSNVLEVLKKYQKELGI